MKTPTQHDLTLLTQTARRLHRRFRKHHELNELISDGYLGLLRAKETFNPSLQVPFRCHARQCIRYAILEGVRERSPLPRTWVGDRAGPSILSKRNFIATKDPEVDHHPAMIDLADHCTTPLPDRSWVAIQLYYFEKFPMIRIAKHLGITEAGVSLLIKRTIREIQQRNSRMHAKRPRRPNRAAARAHAKSLANWKDQMQRTKEKKKGFEEIRSANA